MIDNVSVNSIAEGFWWDDNQRTDDLLVDRLLVMGIPRTRTYQGSEVDYRPNAFALPNGVNVTMKNSVAAGCDGTREGQDAFEWTGNHSNTATPLWNFSEGNVAHNCSRAIVFWTNSEQPHQIEGFVSYRNGAAIANGAYRNANSFADFLSFQDGKGIEQITNPVQSAPSRALYRGFRILSPLSSAIIARGRNLPAEGVQTYRDCVLEAAPGHKKVTVKGGGNPWNAHFIRCGVTPDDFSFDGSEEPITNGTTILIDHEDGRKWKIVVEGGRPVVTTR
jgi:hypothetical protein